MPRTIVVAGNWKMNSDRASAAALAGEIATVRRSAPPADKGFEVACIPPFPYLHTVHAALADSGVRLGAQDIAPEGNGAYTGDVSGKMLADCGCHYVIVGHSERREYHGEGEPLLCRKVARAREAGLTPIICVGEPLQVRQRGSQESFVKEQVLGLFTDLAAETPVWTGFVVAYEPIWAIGTGEVATPAQAQAMCKMIRGVLAGLHAPWAERPVLYGGSVKADNAAELIVEPDVDGFLVGGASLKGPDFSEIIRKSAAHHGG
ncbi:MAG: triose-phosphate isomerase [Planctomycetota bacterium]